MLIVSYHLHIRQAQNFWCSARAQGYLLQNEPSALSQWLKPSRQSQAAHWWISEVVKHSSTAGPPPQTPPEDSHIQPLANYESSRLWNTLPAHLRRVNPAQSHAENNTKQPANHSGWGRTDTTERSGSRCKDCIINDTTDYGNIVTS